jgi:hypothetical protein
LRRSWVGDRSDTRAQYNGEANRHWLRRYRAERRSHCNRREHGRAILPTEKTASLANQQRSLRDCVRIVIGAKFDFLNSVLKGSRSLAGRPRNYAVTIAGTPGLDCLRAFQ